MYPDEEMIDRERERKDTRPENPKSSKNKNIKIGYKNLKYGTSSIALWSGHFFVCDNFSLPRLPHLLL